MAKSKENNKAKSNSDISNKDQLLLAELLKKERSPEQSKLVTNILQTPLSLKEKIGEIQEVDSHSHDSKGGTGIRYVRKDKKTSNEHENNNSKSVIVQKKITVEENFKKNAREEYQKIAAKTHKLRKHLKNVFPKQRFFSYFFKDRIRILVHGKTNFTLESGFLGFNIKIKQDLFKRLGESTKTNAAMLLAPYLTRCLDTDWIYLQKYDYNLLVAAKELCDQVMSIGWEDIPYRTNLALEKLKRLDDSFFLFYSYPNLRQDLYSVLRESLNHHEETQIKPHIVMQRILEPDIVMPSLFDSIYSITMLESKKFIQQYQLYSQINTNPIMETVFETSSDVEESIINHLQGIENELAPLVRQNMEIIRFNSMIPTKGDGKTDLTPLELFYDFIFEGEKESKRTGKFIKDSDNIPFFMYQVCKKLDRHFLSFLTGNFTIYEPGNSDNAHRVKIFDSSLFEVHLRQINRLQNSLDKLSALMPTFSQERYFKLKIERKGAIQTETQIITNIDEVLILCVQVAKSLSKILSLHDNRIGEIKDFVPLRSIDLQKTTLHLPFSNWIISDPSVLNGKSVSEACIFISNVCMILAVHMKENDITQRLYHYEKLKGRITNLTVQLKRLSSPLQFQQFSERYKLPIL